MRKIAIDPGFGGFKVAEVQHGNLATHTLPAVVGVGSTDLGYLGTGFGRQNKHTPHTVTIDGTGYLVGQNVNHYAPPIERLDFQRLSDGPELRALLYAALWRITGAGNHTAALMVGLPVEIVQDKKRTQNTLRTLRGWLVGSHRFAVDGEAVTLTVTAVKGLAQPVGSYFAWGANVNGTWRMSRDALQKPVAICDIGFNTLDLFAVQNGQVFGHFTGGDTLGMHRTADAIVRHVRQTYRHTLSLAEADTLTWTPGTPSSIIPEANTIWHPPSARRSTPPLPGLTSSSASTGNVAPAFAICCSPGAGRRRCRINCWRITRRPSSCPTR